MEELLSLKWNNHRSTFISVLGLIRDKQLYTDVTLACEGKFYSVHKLVLSTCSDYFSAMLERTNCKSPVIVLKDIKSEDLEALLDYMYIGEVNVRQSDLATLIKAAECLRVKGLAVPDDEPPANKKNSREAQPRRSESNSTPPAKRKRRSEVDDGRDDVRNIKLDAKQESPHRPSNIKPKSPSNNSLPVRSSSPIINRRDSSPKTRDSASPTQSYVNDNPEPCVKVEMDEGPPEVETYDISNDGGFKEEGDENMDGADGLGADDGGDMSNELPEFLQQAAGVNIAQGSFGGPSSFSASSSFQSSNIANWQGEGSNVTFPQMNFSTNEGSSPSNAPGDDVDTCRICSKTFTGKNKKNNLVRHLKTHTGERPYSCSHCDYKASRKEHVDRHVKKGSCIFHMGKPKKIENESGSSSTPPLVTGGSGSPVSQEDSKPPLNVSILPHLQPNGSPLVHSLLNSHIESQSHLDVLNFYMRHCDSMNKLRMSEQAKGVSDTSQSS